MKERYGNKIMNYTGIKCPVCEKELKEGEDIVVCPECGAPHHRECYKSIGHCAMTELHEKGIAWENPNLKNNKTGSDQIFCPNCGKANPAENELCENCRSALHPKDTVDFSEESRMYAQARTQSSPPPQREGYGTGIPLTQDELFSQFLGINGENDLIGDVPVKEFIFYVQQNYFYFLRIFKLLCQRTKAVVFNWSAGIFTYLYFFYRKMYKLGALLLLVMFITYIPSLMLYSNYYKQLYASMDVKEIIETMNVEKMRQATLNFVPDTEDLMPLQAADNVFVIVRIVIHVFCGFIANRKYYEHAVNSIHNVKQSLGKMESEMDKNAEIARRGGTNMPLVLFSIFVLISSILGWSFSLMSSFL